MDAGLRSESRRRGREGKAVQQVAVGATREIRYNEGVGNVYAAGWGWGFMADRWETWLPAKNRPTMPHSYKPASGWMYANGEKAKEAAAQPLRETSQGCVVSCIAAAPSNPPRHHWRSAWLRMGRTGFLATLDYPFSALETVDYGSPTIPAIQAVDCPECIRYLAICDDMNVLQIGCQRYKVGLHGVLVPRWVSRGTLRNPDRVAPGMPFAVGRRQEQAYRATQRLPLRYLLIVDGLALDRQAGRGSRPVMKASWARDTVKLGTGPRLS